MDMGMSMGMGMDMGLGSTAIFVARHAARLERVAVQDALAGSSAAGVGMAWFWCSGEHVEKGIVLTADCSLLSESTVLYSSTIQY